LVSDVDSRTSILRVSALGFHQPPHVFFCNRFSQGHELLALTLYRQKFFRMRPLFQEPLFSQVACVRDFTRPRSRAAG